MRSQLVSNRPLRNEAADEWAGVYKVPCQNCPKSYFGETVRPFNVRFREHNSVMRRGDRRNVCFKHSLVQNMLKTNIVKQTHKQMSCVVSKIFGHIARHWLGKCQTHLQGTRLVPQISSGMNLRAWQSAIILTFGIDQFSARLKIKIEKLFFHLFQHITYLSWKWDQNWGKGASAYPHLGQSPPLFHKLRFLKLYDIFRYFASMSPTI